VGNKQQPPNVKALSGLERPIYPYITRIIIYKIGDEAE
jgi:hypothetical protein